MEWKATIVLLEDELVWKTKSLLTSTHLNVILVFSLFHHESLGVKSDWENQNEECVEWKGLLLFLVLLYSLWACARFGNTYTKIGTIFSMGKIIELLCHSDKVSLWSLQPYSGLYISKQTMVCSELLVLSPVFSGHKHGFHSKRAFLVLSQYLGTTCTKGTQYFKR